MHKSLAEHRQAIEVATHCYEQGRISIAKDTLDLVNTRLLVELVEILGQIDDNLAKSLKEKDEAQRLLLEYAPPPTRSKPSAKPTALKAES